MPETKVELGAFTGFTLNDPLLGRLDENPLDGDIVFDEIPKGVFSVSTSRGRDRDIGRTSAGSISVQLRNQDRFFDPFVGVLFSQSLRQRFPFRRFVRPRLPIRASVDGDPIFTGFVDDWNYDYDPSGISTANIVGTDAFSQFAFLVNGGGSAVQETSGARLNRILNQAQVNFLAPRDIDGGNATLLATTLEGNVLSSLVDVVEGSEFGLVFMGKDGTFTFRQRLISPVSEALQFSDGDGIPYQDLQIEFGSEELFNRVIVKSPAGEVTVTDDESRTTFGLRVLEVDTEIATTGGLQGLADFLLRKFSLPDYRFRSLTTNLRALSDEQAADVLALDIGDQVDVEFRPNGISPAISLRNRVIGVSHDVGVDQHLVTFNFENLPFAFFVLNDSVFGKLNNTDGVLGF